MYFKCTNAYYSYDDNIGEGKFILIYIHYFSEEYKFIEYPNLVYHYYCLYLILKQNCLCFSVTLKCQAWKKWENADTNHWQINLTVLSIPLSMFRIIILIFCIFHLFTMYAKNSFNLELYS